MSKIIIPYVKTEGHQCAYNQKTGAELGTIDDLIDDANEELIDSVKEIKKLQSETQALQKENEELSHKLKRACRFIKLVDIYEGEVIDGERFEAEALLDLGELSRQALKEITTEGEE